MRLWSTQYLWFCTWNFISVCIWAHLPTKCFLFQYLNELFVVMKACHIPLIWGMLMMTYIGYTKVLSHGKSLTIWPENDLWLLEIGILTPFPSGWKTMPLLCFVVIIVVFGCRNFTGHVTKHLFINNYIYTVVFCVNLYPKAFKF